MDFASRAARLRALPGRIKSIRIRERIRMQNGYMGITILKIRPPLFLIADGLPHIVPDGQL